MVPRQGRQARLRVSVVHIDRVIVVLEAIGLAVAVMDGVRVRRKHRRYLADVTAEALSGRPNVVNGISLPDPNDHRWATAVENFVTVRGVRTEKEVLTIGQISIQLVNQDLFVGAGPRMPGPEAERYARAVLIAWRQRLSNEAMK